MAPPVSRRPATRFTISSTQEEAEEFPPLWLDGEEEEQQHDVLTQVEDFGLVTVSHGNNSISEHTPQCDNPSQILPGGPDDRDAALEEYTLSQQRLSNREDDDIEKDAFDLPPLDNSDDEDEADDDLDAPDTSNAPPYTQNTLEVASILAGGFSATAEASAASVDDNEELEEETPTLLASTIAAQLRKDGLTGTGLTAEEQAFVEGVDEGKNKKAYDDSQTRYEKRFFETIAKYGGDTLSPLAKEMIANPHDLQEHMKVDHSFYSVVGGEKTADKHHILNKCFILCGMKWVCLSGPKKGKRIQTNSFGKMMQCLTYLFNRKGVKYVFNEDFNAKGDFHGVMTKIWREERKVDPSFGTGANRARVDNALVRKFIQAIREKKIRPYEDPEHCLICVIFILGYYCGLRGSSEHIDLSSEMVYMGEYQVEDGEELAGLRWAGVKVPFSKTNQLNMNNTKLPSDQDVLLTFVEQPDHDCWDPYDIFCFFVDHCHPHARKFYGRLVRQGEQYEGGKLQKQHGRPIWYAESGPDRPNWNLGPTKHRELCKKIALYAGVDDWKKCTGHALRALCINKCIANNLTAVDVAAKVRHRSLNSQKDYATDNAARKANRLLVMQEPSVGDKRKSTTVVEDVHEDAVIVETQPMLPKNRNKFLHTAKKQRREDVEEEAENVMVSHRDLDLEKQLKEAKMKNELLRIQRENLRYEEELTRSNRSDALSPVPRRHRRSYPSSYVLSPLEDRYYYPPSPPRNGYRHSYPPANHHRPRSPPRYHYDDRRSEHYRHGGYTEDEYDEYAAFRSGYHRR